MSAGGDDLWRVRRDLAHRLICAEPLTADAGTGSLVVLLQNLCRALTGYLSVTGAAVNLMSAAGSDGVAAASDQHARELSELAFTTGEGPCHDAFASRRPVLVPDLRNGPGHRWPGYAAAAAEVGLVGVFAFPLHVGAAGFGVLDVFATAPASREHERVTMALVFAQIATENLLDGRLVTDTGELDGGLASALDYRVEIYQAQGMLAVSLRVSLTEALVRMRSRASTHREPLIDVARDVLAGRDHAHDAL